MADLALRCRNKSLEVLYKRIAKPIFFMQDPESVHDKATALGIKLGRSKITRNLTSMMLGYQNKRLEQKILGIKFPNPIGLAAGFDKDAQLVDILPSVGFGFIEVGSITGEPCAGNPRPRLWRLKKSNSLLVYYGLKNKGCEKISSHLSGRGFRLPIGTSIAKTNSIETVDTASGIADYVKAFSYFSSVGTYFTINISCPNAFGGEPFTDPKKLEKLLTSLDKIPTDKPLFLKISPDLPHDVVDKIISICDRHRIHGFICSNLTKKRDNPHLIENNIPSTGGISGKPMTELTNRLISYIYSKTIGRYVIIGCGGVFNAADAYKKIRCGASLVQLITGMIYEGPQVISDINIGLVRLLEKDGFSNISEAIGADVKKK